MSIIGVVADDFTGTASAGMLMAKAGVETGLFFDEEQIRKFPGAEKMQAIYVSSGSRSMSPEAAYHSVQKAVKTLAGTGAEYFAKKIDTTLRGGIGYEMDAMLDFLGEETVAVVVTAMPQSRRICVGGYSVIDSVLLTDTPVARDVKTPVNECSVPELLKKQTRRKTAWIPIGEVICGTEHLGERLAEEREKGAEVFIVDALSLEHIQTIAEACVRLKWSVLSVDPGPFTMKLACCRGIADENAPGRKLLETEDDAAVLIVSGSANPSAGKQIEVLLKETDSVKVEVSAKRLSAGGEETQAEIERAVREAGKAVEKEKLPRAVVIGTALGQEILNLAENDRMYGYQAGTSSRLINEGLACITEKLLGQYRNKIAGMMLTGGDTMEAVCRKIGVSCIRSIDNIVAQVDVGRLLGKYEGMPVVVKGGFCGYDSIVPDIVKRLKCEAVRKE